MNMNYSQADATAVDIQKVIFCCGRYMQSVISRGSNQRVAAYVAKNSQNVIFKLKCNPALQTTQIIPHNTTDGFIEAVFPKINTKGCVS